MPRGRRERWPGRATVVTSVRLPVDLWEWAKDSHIEFTQALYDRLCEMRQDKNAGPVARFVRECRKFGLTDPEVGQVLGFRKASTVIEQDVPIAFAPVGATNVPPA